MRTARRLYRGVGMTWHSGPDDEMEKFPGGLGMAECRPGNGFWAGRPLGPRALGGRARRTAPGEKIVTRTGFSDSPPLNVTPLRKFRVYSDVNRSAGICIMNVARVVVGQKKN